MLLKYLLPVVEEKVNEAVLQERKLVSVWVNIARRCEGFIPV